jgi:hypothetical protein
MVADKQLANEIMFDLRKFEEDARGRRESVMSLAGHPNFPSPQLRAATPLSGSPLMPVNLLLTPGSPNFSPPRLRAGATPSRTNKPSRLSVATSVNPASSSLAFRTPLPPRKPSLEEEEEEEEGRLGGADADEETTPKRPDALAWVRTPVSKVAASPADDIICMESPAFAERKKKEEVWNVASPKFDAVAREKRFNDEDVDPLLDENTSPATTKPQRRSRRGVSGRD